MQSPSPLHSCVSPTGFILTQVNIDIRYAGGTLSQQPPNGPQFKSDDMSGINALVDALGDNDEGENADEKKDDPSDHASVSAPLTEKDLENYADMDLADAQELMGSDAPMDSPQKRAARYLLLQEAQRLERALEDLESGSDGDSDGDAPDSTVAAAAAPTATDPVDTRVIDYRDQVRPPSTAVTYALPSNPPASFETTNIDDSSLEPMDLEEAQTVMQSTLPNEHVDKRRARKTLLKAAADLEAKMAALDNDSDNDSDEQADVKTRTADVSVDTTKPVVDNATGTASITNGAFPYISFLIKDTVTSLVMVYCLSYPFMPTSSHLFILQTTLHPCHLRKHRS